MLISHAFISTLSFLLVDSITRRFKTREITEISGLNYLTPKLFLISLINCQIFLGFPGSIYFISEVLFYTFFLDINPLTGLLLLVLMYLLAPSFFYKSWLNVMFGFSSFNTLAPQKDLTSREFLLYFFLCFIVYWLGFT
jgi:NADH:ubiquinone oxidoreductase subunit 4 (subunit M)